MAEFQHNALLGVLQSFAQQLLRTLQLVFCVGQESSLKIGSPILFLGLDTAVTDS